MPATLVEAPLGIACVFSDGTRAEVHAGGVWQSPAGAGSAGRSGRVGPSTRHGGRGRFGQPLPDRLRAWWRRWPSGGSPAAPPGCGEPSWPSTGWALPWPGGRHASDAAGLRCGRRRPAGRGPGAGRGPRLQPAALPASAAALPGKRMGSADRGVPVGDHGGLPDAPGGAGRGGGWRRPRAGGLGIDNLRWLLAAPARRGPRMSPATWESRTTVSAAEAACCRPARSCFRTWT